MARLKTRGCRAPWSKPKINSTPNSLLQTTLPNFTPDWPWPWARPEEGVVAEEESKSEDEDDKSDNEVLEAYEEDKQLDPNSKGKAPATDTTDDTSDADETGEGIDESVWCESLKRDIPTILDSLEAINNSLSRLMRLSKEQMEAAASEQCLSTSAKQKAESSAKGASRNKKKKKRVRNTYGDGQSNLYGDRGDPSAATPPS